MSAMKSILLIDDDQTLRTLLADVLTLSDFDVSEASNGQEGLDLLLNLHPDVIIVDLMMPVMDGVRFCEALHARQPDHAPIIMLTALENPVETRGLPAEVVAAVLRKPTDFDEILSTIQTLI